jgi:hypothetical protein
MGRRFTGLPRGVQAVVVAVTFGVATFVGDSIWPPNHGSYFVPTLILAALYGLLYSVTGSWRSRRAWRSSPRAVADRPGHGAHRR